MSPAASAEFPPDNRRFHENVTGHWHAVPCSLICRQERTGKTSVKRWLNVLALTVVAAPGMAAEQGLPAADWIERVQLQGDLRLRQENVDAEGKPDISRQRLRARVALDVGIDHHITVGLGLATGGDNPVSSNYTFGDGFSRQDMRLDLAFVDWSAAPDLHVIGGRMKNPFHRPGDNGLAWDADLRLEGAAIHWDNGTLFAVGSLFTPAMDAQGSSRHVAGVQAGGRLRLPGALRLTLGASYYDLDDLEDRSLLYSPDNAHGNTVRTDAAGVLVYATDFRTVEAFAELAMTVAGLPATVFYDRVDNAATGHLDVGWAVGFTLGDTATKGSWALRYVYEDLEADAMPGPFTDSSFGGGGTDARGHVFGGAYALTDRVNVALTWFSNETGQSTGTGRDYERLQVDLNLKY